MNSKKILIGLSLILVSALIISTLKQPSPKLVTPKTNAEVASTTALITNLKGNSGGTGVILKSDQFKSAVLTNAHVCGVVKNGGIITTDKKRSLVLSYKVSKAHDLCLITTNSNLEINTKIARASPEIYDDAIVSGHPQLLPTIITRGMFSDREIINVFTGMRDCTNEELESDLLCHLFGKMPVIKTYESQITSATIQPGSSGSAVFNKDGEISGLIFAGNGNLSYGHLVPLEYIQYFIEVELKNIKSQTPSQELTAQDETEERLKKACKDREKSIDYSIVKDYCKYFDQDFIYQ